MGTQKGRHDLLQKRRGEDYFFWAGVAGKMHVGWPALQQHRCQIVVAFGLVTACRVLVRKNGNLRLQAEVVGA